MRENKWKPEVVLKNKLKIMFLLEETNLQKQKIAKLVGLDNSIVARYADGRFPKRSQRELTPEQMEDYLDYCEALDQIIGVFYG